MRETVRLRAVPCNETQREGSNKLSPAKFLSPARDPFGRWVTNLGLRGNPSLFILAGKIGKCIACLYVANVSDVASSQSARFHARENRIAETHHRSRRTVAQSPANRVWFFDFLLSSHLPLLPLPPPIPSRFRAPSSS